MTTFTRTASGLSNSPIFYQANFTVYIEGKSENVKDGRELPDVHYYAALLRAVRPNKIAKIKVVGNKNSALAYAEKLRDGNVKNAVVIVDKDLEDVTSSALPIAPVIRTFGYSWENELWSISTASNLIQQLANAEVIQREGPSICLPIMAKRLRYLSALDAGAQVGGVTLLPKAKSLCGVNVTFPVVSAKEIKRVASLYRNSAAVSCPVSSSIVSCAIKLEPCQVIQGHFWSNVIHQYIGQAYKRLTNDTAPSKKAMLNLALSFMKRDTATAIGGDLIVRYDNELARFGI